MGLTEEIFGIGIGGGIIIDLGAPMDPSNLATADLPPDSLGYMAEFERTRAEMSKLEADFHLARAEECDAMSALRAKQAAWEADHPGYVPTENDAPYMAFIEPEYSVAVAAVEKTHTTRTAQREYVASEHERLHRMYHDLFDKTTDDVEQTVTTDT